jgi:endo-1,4-beta-xylanase
MQALQPRRGEYSFAASDELLRFARRNGKTMRGHTLIWGQALPLWLVDHGALDRIGLRLPPIALPRLPDPLGRLVRETTTLLTGWRRDELTDLMKDHIRTVMRHYRGDIAEWDVVNEPIADDGSLAPTVWRRFIGPDCIEQALRTAHAADPRARLLINDFAVESTKRR